MELETLALNLLPNIPYDSIQDMTLLDIDHRVEFILEAQREKEKWKLKDLSTIIFYGVAYGFGVIKSKKVKEADFHKTIDKLLSTACDSENSSTTLNSVENDLKSIFG